MNHWWHRQPATWQSTQQTPHPPLLIHIHIPAGVPTCRAAFCLNTQKTPLFRWAVKTLKQKGVHNVTRHLFSIVCMDINVFIIMVYSYEEKTYVPPYICHRDACWSEFFYPFMDIYPGESQQKTLCFALMFSLIIILGIAIACPLSIGPQLSRW